MPSGKTHAKHTAVASAIILCWLPIDAKTSILASIGCLSGLLVGPDLDVDNGNISMFFLRKIHPFISFVWRVYWFPYARLMKHRSFWSHAPVFSTAIRMLYMLPGLYFFYLLFGELGLKFDFKFDIIILLPIFIGLAISDSVHWLADKIY